MASLKEILSWFEKNKYPTQEQFKESWTSFWHKSEKMPMEQVVGLQDELSDKAQQSNVDDVIKSVEILASTKADKSIVDALQNGIIKQPSVETYSDLLIKYPNPELGWDVLVKEGNTRYNWNGSQWVNMETGIYDSQVATKDEIAQLAGDLSAGRNITSYAMNGYVNGSSDKYDRPIAYTPESEAHKVAVLSVRAGEEIIVVYDRRRTNGACFVDNNGKLLSSIDLKLGKNIIEAPDGAVTMAITLMLNNVGELSRQSIILNTPFLSSVLADRDDVISLKDKTEIHDKEINKLQDINNIIERSGKNKYNKEEVIEGVAVATNGEDLMNKDSAMTGLIPVNPNSYYYLSGRLHNSNTRSIRCFLEDKTTSMKVLSALNGKEITDYYLPNLDASGSSLNGMFKTPENAAYIQVSLKYNRPNLVGYDLIMLEYVGTSYDPTFSPSTYEDYAEGFFLKKSALPKLKPEDIGLNSKDIVNKKPTIKILCVGNSFTQNSFGYVPNILHSLKPDIECVVAIAYIGGSPLAQHLASISGQNQEVAGSIYEPKKYTYQKNSNGSGWVSTSSRDIDFILSDENWDVITFQQSGGQSDKDWSVYYEPFIYKIHKIIYEKLERSIKFGWVMIHGSYSKDDEGLYSKWKGTSENSLKIMNNTATDVLFPYGTAVQNLRTTSLKELGNGSAANLMTDNAHLQAGIGEMVASYANALRIIELLGLTTKLVGDKYRIIDGDGIIVSEVIGVTDDNCYLAQAAAINAIKKPYEITDMSFFEIISS